MKQYCTFWNFYMSTCGIISRVMNHISTYETIFALWNDMSVYGIILRNMNDMSSYETRLRIRKPFVLNLIKCHQVICGHHWIFVWFFFSCSNYSTAKTRGNENSLKQSYIGYMENSLDSGPIYVNKSIIYF